MKCSKCKRYNIELLDSEFLKLIIYFAAATDTLEIEKSKVEQITNNIFEMCKSLSFINFFNWYW